jgi:hypothetical protein
MGKKILNLLFDTFHSTKYFHAHLSIIACHFCICCFTYSNAMKIFMVDYVLHDEANVIFLDFSEH